MIDEGYYVHVTTSNNLMILERGTVYMAPDLEDCFLPIGLVPIAVGFRDRVPFDIKAGKIYVN